MKQVTTIKELREYLDPMRRAGKSTGFVPTMGALHEGHLSLIRNSLKENDITVCSIFVNPTQFNNPDDLEKYPRMPEADAALLERTGCDLLFLPGVDEMYPANEDPINLPDPGPLVSVMEGKFRPGHFRGVALIVNKLFQAVQPERAYLGKKDYQQLAVIRHLVRSLGLPVEIIGCETLREQDGLAMSSRNMRLTKEQRDLASGIFKTLCYARDHANKLSPEEICLQAFRQIDALPGFRTEYFEIADAETLQPVIRFESGQTSVACTAVYAGEVRLIDNMEIFS